MILRKAFPVIFLSAMFLFALTGQRAMAKAPVRIACVGDSITWGVGLPNRHTQVYAALLQKRLGKAYRVLDCGHPGATALKHIAADHPSWMASYWQVSQFKRATAFKPNIVIIMLGTNDSNPCNRRLVRKDFTRDYSDLVRHFQKLSTHPRIFICLPPSLENGTVKGPYPAIPAHGVVARIVRIVHSMHLKSINIFHALAGRWNLFIRDRVHPNVQGQAIMAGIIYHALLKAGAVHP
jgi:sialate O-acetylesterase